MQIILIASITRTKNYIIINTNRTVKRAIHVGQVFGWILKNCFYVE
jgi:hypothetical protein